MAEAASDGLRLRQGDIGWPLEELWVEAEGGRSVNEQVNRPRTMQRHRSVATSTTPPRKGRRRSAIAAAALMVIAVSCSSGSDRPSSAATTAAAATAPATSAPAGTAPTTTTSATTATAATAPGASGPAGLKRIDPAGLQALADGMVRDALVPGVMMLLQTPQGTITAAAGTTEL